MASSSKRDEKRDLVTVSEELAVAPAVKAEAVVEAKVEKAVVKEVVAAFNSYVSPNVQSVIDSAPKGWTVKIKSEKDFNAATAALKSSNPNNIKVVHKPSLGHHSVAVG